MLGKNNNAIADPSAEYREETVKVPVIITVVVVLLISMPFVFWISKINNEGARANNVSKYDELVQLVANDVRTVDAMLRKDADELAAINSGRRQSVVTLIVPEVLIVEDRQEAPKQKSALNVELDGIYWNPSNPLASIDGETYRVGDKIQGYEIVTIGKTKVQFQSSDGTIVVKDMYGDLLKGR